MDYSSKHISFSSWFDLACWEICFDLSYDADPKEPSLYLRCAFLCMGFDLGYWF
jgi:hypothetical protein